MFLFGLRDPVMIKFCLRVVLLYICFLFFVFKLDALMCFIFATLLTILFACLITMKLARMYPLVAFGRPADRAHAFPKNPVQRKISYFRASFMTVAFFMGLIIISARSDVKFETSIVVTAIIFLAFGFPGVVNFIFLLHPISHAEENE